MVLNLVGRGLNDTEGEIPNILTDTLAGEVGAVAEAVRCIGFAGCEIGGRDHLA